MWRTSTRGFLVASGVASSFALFGAGRETKRVCVCVCEDVLCVRVCCVRVCCVRVCLCESVHEKMDRGHTWCRDTHLEVSTLVNAWRCV